MVIIEQGCSDMVFVSVEVIEVIDIIGVSNSVFECLYGVMDVMFQVIVFFVNDGIYDFFWIGLGYNFFDEVVVIENVMEVLNGGSYFFVVFIEEGCFLLLVSMMLQVKDVFL